MKLKKQFIISIISLITISIAHNIVFSQTTGKMFLLPIRDSSGFTELINFKSRMEPKSLPPEIIQKLKMYAYNEEVIYSGLYNIMVFEKNWVDFVIIYPQKEIRIFKESLKLKNLPLYALFQIQNGVWFFEWKSEYLANFDLKTEICVAGNCKNGDGTLTFKDGSKYVGEFKNFERNGKGTVFDSKGSIAQRGTWINDQFIGGCFSGDCIAGNGVYQFSNGSKYIGEFKNSVRHGIGQYISSDFSSNGIWESGIFIGECVSGNCNNGRGRFIYPSSRSFDPNMSTSNHELLILLTKNKIKLNIAKSHEYHGSYDGEWENGLFHGKGKLECYADSSAKIELDGQWARGEFMGGCLSGDCLNGNGIEIDKDGFRYEGFFKNGEKDGFGSLEYPDGYGNYTGEWKEGKRNGHGEERFSNGRSYSGDWKNDKYHGEGTRDGGLEYPPHMNENLKEEYNPIYEGRDKRTGLGTQNGKWVNGEYKGGCCLFR